MMSSQNNHSKVSLSKISNFVLTEQNIDIKNYTVGHLNENHLQSNVFGKPRKSWKNASKLARKASNRKLSRPPSKPYSSMSDINDILADFENFEKKLDEKYQDEDTFVNDKTIETEGFIKLPRIETNKIQTNSSAELSTLNSESDINFWFPITDKEMAMSCLNGPFKGASKTDKFNNFAKFEKLIIRKENLTTTNALHSIDSISWLEKKLQTELDKLEMTATSDHKFQINIYRLDIFNNVFEQIIMDSKLFGIILNKIKIEYDEYLFYLLRNQQLLKLNHKKTGDKLDMARSLYTNKMDQTKVTTNDINNVHKSIYETMQENLKLEEKIHSETEFNIEKENEFVESELSLKTPRNDSEFDSEESNRNESNFSTDRDTESLENFPRKKLISENLESTKIQIMKKIEDLEGINKELRADYVPIAVVNNFNRSIKDIEMETNKINEQNKYLINKANEMEKNLKDLLMNNDKTEFADENTDLLLKMISNFGVLVTNESMDILTPEKANTIVQQNSLTNDCEIKDEKVEKDDVENFFDDYFS